MSEWLSLTVNYFLFFSIEVEQIRNANILEHHSIRSSTRLHETDEFLWNNFPQKLTNTFGM